VTAPLSGRVGRDLVDKGNLVGDGEATQLTTVTSYHPMYAYFNLNERDLLRVMARYRERVRETGMDPDQDSNDRLDISPVWKPLLHHFVAETMTVARSTTNEPRHYPRH